MAKPTITEGMIVRVERGNKFYCNGKTLQVSAFHDEIPVGGLYLANTAKSNEMVVRRANKPGITRKHYITGA